MAVSNAPSVNDSADGSRLQRAERLSNVFRDRVPEATVQRRLHQDTVDDMRAAGFIRAYVPERFGGDALHMVDVLPTVAKLAEGCTAAAWVLAVYQIHNWVVALMPDSVQQEVFAAGPDPVVAASLNPMKNSATKVDGGYLIERGSFPFCSGAPARDWVLLGIHVRNDDGDISEVGTVLVPGADLIEDDDWYVSGLQATGSVSLTCEDLFIPQARFLSYALACDNGSPGIEHNPHSLFRAAFVPMLVLNLAGPALGVADRALRDYVDLTMNKPGAYPITGEMRVDAPQAHTLIAEAEMRIDIARLLLNRAGQAIRDAAANTERMPRTLAAKTCVDTTWAVRECMHAVQGLFLNSGGGALNPDHPMQRAFQDVSAINCHGFLSHESAVRLYGALVTGHPEPTAFI